MEQRRDLECTLGPEELVDRRAAWGDVAAALVDRVRTESGFRARFRRSPDISDALSALVAAERDCCGWASWALSDEGNCVVLDVTGPPDRIGALAAAFRVVKVADGLGIQEVARQSGVSASALLLLRGHRAESRPASSVGSSALRRCVLDRLTVITSAQRAGFTLAEVGELLSGMTLGGAVQNSWRVMATRKLPEIAGLIEEFRGMRRLLEDLASCECRDLSQCAALLRACPGPGSAGPSQRGCG